MGVPEGFWDDPIGRASTIATGVGAIVVGLVYVVGKLRAMAHDLGLVKEEVKNNHDTNLREEADERHAENGSKLDDLLEAVTELRENDRNLFRLIVSLTGRTDEIDERTGGHPLHITKDEDST